MEKYDIELVQTMVEVEVARCLKAANQTGPGSIYMRYHHLLNELEKRFPPTTSEMVSSAKTPERNVLDKIDILLEFYRTNLKKPTPPPGRLIKEHQDPWKEQ